MSKNCDFTKFNIIYIIYKYLDWKIEFAEIELLIQSTILWISFYIDNLGWECEPRLVRWTMTDSVNNDWCEPERFRSEAGEAFRNRAERWAEETSKVMTH